MVESHEEQEDFENEDTSASAASLASTAAFKARLERFKHSSGNNPRETTPTAPSPIRRSTRKRDRPDDNEPTNQTKAPTKRKKSSSKYAPPSTYAHLEPLTDILAPNLITIFVGFNPGVMTATAGHAYAHPSNLFWKLLHSSGCTDERLKPEQDVDLPRLYSMGNTNIVARPSKNAGELSKAESAAGTPILEAKIKEFKPESVCIVGKGIWESIWRWKYGRPIKKEEFRYGWQDERERMGKDEGWEGAWVFVATATSGLAAGLRPHEKEAIWRPFGEWVSKRRRERREAEKIKEDEEAK
ncbi:hypothetical protein PRZ48_004340 [Zasmidium cellare]|uniref:Uracil-DNA glycosylase-like domain-containing protein n=1 Tax=Zasmidium cellare TaxID=395010 RepID=A0ABR0EQA4_ZASCE|nr:hypothetical protein PRZ48_004340 [Zasmidium cellare]